MTTERSERHEQAAMGLARVARLLDERIDEPRHAAGRARLLAALGPMRRRWTARRTLLFAAALALPLAVLAVTRWPTRIQYDLAGPVVTDGAWLDVPPSGGALAVHFSEGTEVDLGPGSQGRIEDLTANGARVVLGGGVLQARVVHRPRARWAVAAGPYTVEVTGTAFDVEWSAERAQLDVRLHDGSVVVRGPSLPEGLRVAAGQRLVARASTGEARLSSLLAAPLQDPPSQETAPQGDAKDAPASSAARGLRALGSSDARSASRPPPTWSEMIGDGNFHGVVDAAQERGLDATIARAPLADVVALADAARYLHDRALARRGLLAERARFSGSSEARGAAFLLGRMADDDASRDEAIRWYDAYLAESPRGAFAAEAMGRKLVALVDSGDSGGAGAVARQYLTRFPNGPHAAYAREHLP